MQKIAAAYTQTASSANITQNVVTSQSIKVRILWIADITIATGVNILTSYLSVTGNTRYFGQMVILLVVLAKYHQLLYKSTLKAKVNVYEFTRLLPPPKGSGFPPTTTERIIFMKLSVYTVTGTFRHLFARFHGTFRNTVV